VAGYNSEDNSKGAQTGLSVLPNVTFYRRQVPPFLRRWQRVRRLSPRIRRKGTALGVGAAESMPRLYRARQPITTFKATCPKGQVVLKLN